jgi:hypothetical protein
MANTAVVIPNTFANASGTVQTVLLDQDYSALASQANNLNQANNFYADTGSANALSITVPSGLAYAFTAGLEFQVKVGNTNTSTTVTLQVNSATAVALRLPTLAAPSVGTILSGMILTLVYDGTYFQIQTALTGGTSGSFSTLTVSGTSTLTGNVTIGAPASGVALTVDGYAGSAVITAVSNSGSSGGYADLLVNRAGSTINNFAAGPCVFLNDTVNGGTSLLQQSGGQTELWQYNGGWNQVMKFLTSRGVVINAPASGAALQISGVGTGQDQVILNSSNGTGAAGDYKVVRTNSTANSVATGPNIELYDSGGGGTSLLQQSGGQTELWQYNGGWNQIFRVLSTRGVEIRAPASGYALAVDGATIAGPSATFTGSYATPQLNLNSAAYGMGVDASGNVFFKNTNNGVYNFYNSSGSVVATLSNGELVIAAPPANTQALQVNGGAATPTIALSAGGSIALDASRGNVFTASVTSNATVTISNMASGQTINLRTTTSGAYTIGFSPTPKWAGGTAGTATSSGTDLWTIFYDGTNYYAAQSAAFA